MKMIIISGAAAGIAVLALLNTFWVRRNSDFSIDALSFQVIQMSKRVDDLNREIEELKGQNNICTDKLALQQENCPCR